MWHPSSYTNQKAAPTSTSTSAGAQRGHLTAVNGLQE